MPYDSVNIPPKRKRGTKRANGGSRVCMTETEGRARGEQKVRLGIGGAAEAGREGAG